MKLPYVVMVCRPPGRCRGRREQCRKETMLTFAPTFILVRDGKMEV